MKKILIVNDHFPPHAGGGANMIAFFHAKGLLERGYDVRVFTTTQDKEAPIGWSEYQGLKIYTFYTSYNLRWWGYKSVYNGQVVSKFKNELEKIKPDIVHFHNIHNYFSYHTILLAKRSGAKVFMTMHDVMSFTYQKLDTFINRADTRVPEKNNYKISWLQNLKIAKKRFNPIRNFLVRRYLARADKLVAVSSALRDALLQNGIHNVDVVHNGVPLENFEHPASPATEPTVLYMGRLTPPKGSEVLFEAMSLVTRTLPNAKLLA
ncbi:MAG: glycosyltransferase family 4 protein, partial [bacterium]|nr:glycosyltransferase family 4 protein [bacterium]